MNKIWIIIQREFLVRVKKKSFILLTILMPFLIVGIVALPVWLSTLKSGDVTRVAVIDTDGSYQSLFTENEDDIVFTSFVAAEPDVQLQVRQLLDKDDDVVMYCQGSIADGSVTLYSDGEVPKAVERYATKHLTQALRKARLAEFNADDVERITSIVNEEYSVRTVRLDKGGGETESSSDIASFVGLMLSLLIYMFILSYGGMVMQGVSEEKTNRIMEIMVSSVKPFQLMMGKIIGVALVGLFQCFIWIVLVSVLFMVAGTLFGISGAMPDTSAMAAGMNLPAEAASNAPMADVMKILQGMNLVQMVVLFIFYFIGGYLLYASLFAAIGASINEQADSQQFMMPIILLFVFALYAGMFSIENPDGPLAFWCSLIPLTSPVVMMVRLPFDVPLWQIALSLLLLYGTSLLIVWLSAKIYRVGILMYGKKPSFKEMIKWIRYN